MAKKVTAPPVPEAKPTVELAGVGVRLAAVVYDGLLILAFNAIVAAILIGIATPAEVAAKHEAVVLPDWFRHLILFPAMMIMTWLFYGYFWRKNGQTLGMQTWRIKVIKPNGELLTWADAAGRCAAAVILPTICGLTANVLYGSSGAFALSLLFGFIGNYAWSWINRRGFAWHDQLSATVVIRVPIDPKLKRSVLGWFSKSDDE